MTTLITGASSGIGKALAEKIASKNETLFLCARDITRLNEVAEICRARGANVYAKVVDVTNKEAMKEWIFSCDKISPIERVFSNAGVGTGVESNENIRNTFAINVDGALNVVLPILDLFRASPNMRARRQILLTASIAGYGALKSCPSYSATKACLKTWGLALRGMLKSEGIEVNVICPGFVRSRLTDKNTCPMPFFMEAEKAARIILKRADKNVGLIAFPWPMRLATWLLSILPFRLNEFINNCLPAKVLPDKTKTL